MYTDLFLALLNRKNAREHHILSAMLYVFCPAAARWWLVGVDPILPFDPVWKALEDLVSGETLHDVLVKYGFDGLKEEIKAYIREVEVYRRQHPVRSPELMPLFRGGKIPAGRRFGFYNAINNLGGDWRNLFIYVRTWAFLSQDWRIGMQIERDSGYKLTGEKVCLSLPITRIPIQFDTWVWRIPREHVTETRIGLLVSNQEQDQLRFSLMRRCTSMGKQPWPNTPTIFGLDRETGEATHFDQILSASGLEKVVEAFSIQARKGPHPPLNALRQPSICKQCGFQHLCLDKNFISSHALSTL